jgi:uncharacterized membrane protein YsdA (DUF1294 family)
MIYFILTYLAVINLDGLIIMGADKRRAKKNLRRIPEATIFLVALLGGSLGVLSGMYAFRHKTLHTKFTVGIPLILFFETVLTILIIYVTL